MAHDRDTDSQWGLVQRRYCKNASQTTSGADLLPPASCVAVHQRGDELGKVRCREGLAPACDKDVVVVQVSEKYVLW